MIKLGRSSDTVFEHYAAYPKLPFGRAREFLEVKDSQVVIKRQTTTEYVHWGIFSWPKRKKVSFIIYVTHYFRNGLTGGVAMYNVDKGVLEEHVEKCYQHPPRPNWIVLV